MDPKEIKSTLKNAREAIRKKEFKDALKQCKLILSEDKNHYMALVLVAVAAEGLEQHDQALKAYKRAVDVDCQQVLALQGLSAFYEKNPSPEHHVELMEVYKKLAEAYKGEPEKRLEVMRKLADLCSTTGQTDEAVKAYNELLTEDGGGERKAKYQQTLVSLLVKSASPDSEEQLMKLCTEMVDGDTVSGDSREVVLGIFLTGIMKKCDGGFVSACRNVSAKYPQSLTAVEYLVIGILDSKIGEPLASLDEADMAAVDQLANVAGDGGCAVLSMVHGYVALCRGDLRQARQLLSDGLGKRDTTASTYYFLCVTLLRLHDNPAAIRHCAMGLKVLESKRRELSVPSTGLQVALHELEVRAHYAQGTTPTLESALKLLEQHLDCSEARIRVLKGLIHVRLGQVDKAEECVCGSSSWSVALQGKILQYRKQYTEAANKFRTAVEMEPACSEHLLDLARCYWVSATNKPDCFTALLKAAKLDPYSSEVFLYLGHYYSQAQADTDRARKCYQKSFDLDQSNGEAGAQLCDLLTAAGNEAEAYSLLQRVTSGASAGGAKWAWLRLGLHQMKHDDPSVAIASLQATLRADASDNHVWECLAEAYYQRGSYTASLKAFTKASELDPDSVYCLFQIAAIKQTLGTYSEAIAEYELILEKSPDYVPALKGLGETYLLQARSLLRQVRNGRAQDLCQQAMLYLTRAVSHRPDLSCLWKLMGDACTMLHVLPSESFRFKVPARLVKKEDTSPDDTATVDKLETLQLGGRCFGKALKILPECSSLWHDLGVNYFHQSETSTGEAVKSLAKKSADVLKKAILLEPANHKHWTAFGFVSCFQGHYRPELAQHCFIKSIQAEANNVVAWSNLAALYLKNENVELAHQAFKIAQSLEPSYVACWVGQAMIAEIVGHEDAMDLFRHTTELGNHPESALGYGHWVCHLLLQTERHNSELYRYAIHQMAAIPAASDVLARYLEREHTNADAYNMYGLLLEHQKLYKSSAEAFSRAVVLLEASPEKLEELARVRCNYARLLCHCGRYGDAVEMFGLVQDLSDLSDLCQLALALYKVGQLESSFKAYSKAAELSTSDAEKSHIYAAVAMVSYKFGDREGAKSALFNSSQVSDPSPWGLKALCALGLLQADMTLALAALQELLRVGDTDDHRADVLKLAVCLSVVQGDTIATKSLVQRHLHRNPLQASLWRLLSVVLVQFFPECGRAAASAAKCAQALDWSSCKETFELTCSGQLNAGLHDVTGCHGNSALLTAQRLVHLYPGNAEHWVSLASAVHAEAMLSESKDRRLALLADELVYLKYVHSCDVSLELRLWGLKQSVVCALHAGKQGDALESLEQMLTEFGSSGDVAVFFEVFKCLMKKNTTDLLSLLTNNDTQYYWQLLVEMYAQAGLKQEVEAALKQRSQPELSTSPHQQRLTSLIQLLHSTFLQSLGSDDKHRRSVFEEVANQALELDPDCVAVHLMLGAIRLQDNIRASKHHIQNVLCRRHLAGSRGHDLSLARRILIYILHTSRKDPETIQVLVKEAEWSQDQETMQYYTELVSRPQ